MRSHKANSRPNWCAYLRLSAVQLCRPQNTFVPGILAQPNFGTSLLLASLDSSTVFSHKFMEMLFMKRLIVFYQTYKLVPQLVMMSWSSVNHFIEMIFFSIFQYFLN